MMLAVGKGGRKARNAYTRQKQSGRRKPARVLSSLKGGGRRFVGGLKTVAAVTALLGGLALILVLVSGASLWLYNQALTSDFFTTRHVDISGNVRLTRSMVLEFAGIREGGNSLAVSIADVERKLRQTPWVEEASVKRLLPDRFVIRLKERLPSFWVRRGEELYYANERGEAIAPVESKNFLSLPTLWVQPGAEDDVPYLANLLQCLKRGELPVEAGAVSSVTLSPGSGVEIYLGDREMRLSIATDDWAGNVVRLNATLDDLARRKELSHVREVRSVNGNVWVRLDQAA